MPTNEGLLDFDFDPSSEDWTSTLDPGSIGQAYYSLGAEDAGGTSMFWYDLLQNFLPQSENPGGNISIGSDYMTNQDYSLGQYAGFMDMYGQYLPQDFGLGQSRIERGTRLNRAGVDLLHKETASQAANLRTQYGKSGFASSGLQKSTGQDIWSDYVTAAKGRQENLRQMEYDVHADFGQSILDTLTGMAGDSASGQFFVGPWGEGSSWQDWYDEDIPYVTGSGGYVEGDTFSTVTEIGDTGWTQAIYDYCTNPNNVGQEYYAMCEDWNTSLMEASYGGGG